MTVPPSLPRRLVLAMGCAAATGVPGVALAAADAAADAQAFATIAARLETEWTDVQSVCVRLQGRTPW